MIKVALFDMDGVLNLYPSMFSKVYAQKKGLDPKPIEDFFKKEWADILTGKVDLKKRLKQYSVAWDLHGDPQALLDDWFKTEDFPNNKLLKVIQNIRSNGIKCYLATNNEPYRVEYIRNYTFKDQLDGIFSSGELRFKKPDSEFFKQILKQLKVKPREVAYFDDSPSHVEVAQSLGIKGFVYENPKQVEQIMKESK